VPGRHLIGQLADHEQRIAGHRLGVGAAVVRVVLVLERKRAVGADPTGQVGIAARHEHQIAVQRAVLANRARAIDSRVETVVGAQQLEGGALGHQLGRGPGDEQLVGVEGEHRRFTVEIVERDAEGRAAVLRSADDPLDALGERCGRRRGDGGVGLCTRALGLSGDGARAEGEEPQHGDGCPVHDLAWSDE
jgi:hypothetical protein